MSQHSSPLPERAPTRRLSILAQDPTVRVGREILTTEAEIPAEELAVGLNLTVQPRGV